MAFADSGIRTIKEGFLPVKITLGEACAKGDLLGYSSGWKLADGDNSIYPELVAGEAGASGDVITAFRGAVVNGFSDATAGNLAYLSDTAGDYGESAGTVQQVVGVFTDTDEAVILPVGPAHLSKQDMADEVTYTVPLTVAGSFDNQTVKVADLMEPAEVVGVTYFTAGALGEGLGIDVVDGGADGTGTDVICSCSDNLNGLEVEDTISATHGVLAAGDVINVTIDDLASAVYCVVTIWLKVIVNAQ